MIDLITGTPGAGKTLLALWDVEARRKAEKREVFYSGIQDLNLPWKIFGDVTDPKRPHMTDPSEWYKLPDGALIVIDECQRLYRPRANGSAVPKFVSELETHRHRGLDIVLITQNPLLVDSNVRKLVDSHQHLMRKFGSTWATIHAWKGVKENVDKTRSDSSTREFKYPKEIYSWYKSAEVHTAKFKLPFKVKLFIALPFILAAAVWFATSSVSSFAKPKTVVPELSTSVEAGGKRNSVRVQTAAEYSGSFVPRVEGFAFSAPRYDDLTKPVTVPVPSACVSSKSRCKCYTDQATVFPTTEQVCRQIALGGIYIDFETKPAPVERRLDPPAPSASPAPSMPSRAVVQTVGGNIRFN